MISFTIDKGDIEFAYFSDKIELNRTKFLLIFSSRYLRIQKIFPAKNLFFLQILYFFIQYAFFILTTAKIIKKFIQYSNKFFGIF